MLLGVGVVEVARLAVRRALVVAAREALEHDRTLAAARQLPRRRQSHNSAADDHDPHDTILPRVTRRPRGPSGRGGRGAPGHGG